MISQRTTRAIMFLVLAIVAGFALVYTFTTLAQAQGTLSLPEDGLSQAGENRAAIIVGPVVDTDVDESDGSCDDGDCSLRDAIAVAGITDTVTFESDYTIYLSSTLGTLTINKKLTIDASGNPVTVSGDTGNDGSRDVQVFNIGSGGVVTLSHLIVVSGTAAYGGGINNSTGGTLTLLNCTVTDNYASESGGGIRVAGGVAHLSIISSTVSGNKARNIGGGISLGGGAGVTMAITDSVISYNEAGGRGGGIIYFAPRADHQQYSWSWGGSLRLWGSCRPDPNR